MAIQHSELEKMDLLVIDDEQEICSLLAALLKRNGATVTLAHSVVGAQEVLDQGRYDLVFLDINLPDGSGHDLIPHIQRTSPKARIVAISAMEGEARAAKENGADMFIAKPFDQKAILVGMERLLGRHWTN
jgi:DNA-binding response OmpR family regulator